MQAPHCSSLFLGPEFERGGDPVRFVQVAPAHPPDVMVKGSELGGVAFIDAGSQ